MEYIGGVLNVLGSLIALISNINFKKDIKKQTEAICGGNPHLEKSLIKQSILSAIGFSMITIGFILQLISK